jgi:hypothetical protein
VVAKYELLLVIKHDDERDHRESSARGFLFQFGDKISGISHLV